MEPCSFGEGKAHIMANDYLSALWYMASLIQMKLSGRRKRKDDGAPLECPDGGWNYMFSRVLKNVR